MIAFNILATGSKGNLYTLAAGDTRLIIEAGLPIRRMKKALNFKMSSYDGIFITHGHQDHCKAVPDILNRRGGINVYASQGTFDLALNNTPPKNRHRMQIIEPREQIQIKDFSIIPLETYHDTDGSLGFVFKYHEELFLFITDTGVFPNIEIKKKYKITVAIECNYSDLINKNLANGTIHEALLKRIKRYHLGIEDVKYGLSRLSKSQNIKEVYLLHHSEKNCDIKECEEKIIHLLNLKPKYYLNGGIVYD